MKHINLFRTMPVACAITAVVYMVLSHFTRGALADLLAGVLGIAAATVFYIQIRLGRLPWFEKKDGKAHRFIVWLENKLPFLSAEF